MHDTVDGFENRTKLRMALLGIFVALMLVACGEGEGDGGESDTTTIPDSGTGAPN